MPTSVCQPLAARKRSSRLMSAGGTTSCTQSGSGSGGGVGGPRGRSPAESATTAAPAVTRRSIRSIAAPWAVELVTYVNFIQLHDLATVLATARTDKGWSDLCTAELGLTRHLPEM